MITIPTHILKRTDIYAPSKMILAVVEANPDITFRGVAQILFMSPITVKDSMKNLHQRGLVTMTGKGRTFTYRINDQRAI